MAADPFDEPIPHLGSFQAEGPYFRSENPLEEVWQRLARFGAPQIAGTVIRGRGTEPTAELTDHVRARLGQAIEFREAARGRSILASPLVLYYSFLNLARSLVTLRLGHTATPAHGLRFEHPATGNILDCAAKTSSGTFADLLELTKASCPNGTCFTLRQIIASIPEMLDVAVLEVERPRVAQLKVAAFFDQPGIELRFHRRHVPKDFRDRWRSLLPQLDGRVELASGGPVLTVTDDIPHEDYSAIAVFCQTYLMPDLIVRDDPIWYAPLADSLPPLDRAAYYLMGMFILSSVVRYHPDPLVAAYREGSDVAWVLERFIAKAERFFPQLVYGHIARKVVYF
jgi:hypothetical protein